MSYINNINRINIFNNQKYNILPFYKNNKPLLNDSPKWAMTFKSCSSMRFRWNENNINRNNFINQIKKDSKNKELEFVPVELIHSKIVYDVSSYDEIINKTGDGIITNNKNLVPIVTVADCVPLYLYDSYSKVFGVVHSGWKGTGIIQNAIELNLQKYSGKIEDICIAIGAHIKNCCYIINEERAEYFYNEFCNDCVSPLNDDFFTYKPFLKNWDYGKGKLYLLSLEKANLFVLEKCGIKAENIVIANECTCCNEGFGSNRREVINAVSCIDSALIDKSKAFTVQGAFVGYI